LWARFIRTKGECFAADYSNRAEIAGRQILEGGTYPGAIMGV
jgi:hypothetical protein